MSGQNDRSKRVETSVTVYRLRLCRRLEEP